MRGLSSFFGHRIPVARLAEPICAQCRIQVRSSGRHPEQISQQWRSSRQLELSRSFHGTKWNLQNLQGGSTPQGPKEASSTDPTVHRVPDEKLPSHRIQQRWNLSKKFHLLMDDLMKNLAIAGQQINTYTGTDYSGIAALRNEIKEQGTTNACHSYSILMSCRAARKISTRSPPNGETRPRVGAGTTDQEFERASCFAGEETFVGEYGPRKIHVADALGT